MHSRGKRVNRKRILAAVVLATSVAFIAVGVAAAAYRDEIMADAPRGYWRFGEASGTTAADETAFANPGTYTGGVTLGVAGALSGDSNTAASFDGSDDYVTMGDPSDGDLDFGVGDFTIEAWIKTSVNGERVVASKYASSSPDWRLTVTDDAGQAGRLRFQIDTSGSTRTHFSNVAVDNGAWHHVVVLVDRGTAVSFYVDGAAAGTENDATGGTVDNSGSFLWGDVSGSPNFQGQIDEPAVYAGLLTPARIAAHFNAGSGPPQPDYVPESLASSPSSPVAGAVISFSATVRNAGAAAATVTSSTRLRLDVNNDGSYDVFPPDASTGALAAGGTEAESWPDAWTSTAGTHKFEVCVDNGSAISESSEANNCTTQTFTVAAPPVACGPDCYVSTTGSDSNPGTIDAPWRTIGKALTTLSPGQRALVRGGTYQESPTYTRALANFITVEAYREVAGAGEPAAVWQPAAGGGRPLEVATAATHLRVKGMVIEGATPCTGGNVDIYGDQVELINNEVRNAADQGIYLEESSDHAKIRRNWIHHNGNNCRPPGAGQQNGIYLQGDDHFVENNVVQDQAYGFGIQHYDYGRRATIAHNTIVASGHAAIVLGGGGSGDEGTGVSGFVVANNIVYGSGSGHYGIEWDGTLPSSCQVRNTVAFANPAGAIEPGAPCTVAATISQDPLFVNYAARDLHLQANSPAVNQGDPAYLASPDRDGNSRLPDVGAYER